MAHIGKSYKLQFRRDLADTRNNRDGYPECFGLVLENVDGSIGTMIDRQLYQLVNVEKDSQPPMQWKNESIVVAGTLLKFYATVVDPLQAIEAKWTIQIKHGVTGAILFELKPTPGIGAVRFPVWPFPSVPPTVQTPQIHALGTNVGSSLTAQGWSVYNP